MIVWVATQSVQSGPDRPGVLDGDAGARPSPFKDPAMLVKYYEPPRLEDLPPDSPQFYWAAYRAAVANAMIAERFL